MNATKCTIAPVVIEEVRLRNLRYSLLTMYVFRIFMHNACTQWSKSTFLKCISLIF